MQCICLARAFRNQGDPFERTLDRVGPGTDHATREKGLPDRCRPLKDRLIEEGGDLEATQKFDQSGKTARSISVLEERAGTIELDHTVACVVRKTLKPVGLHRDRCFQGKHAAEGTDDGMNSPTHQSLPAESIRPRCRPPQELGNGVNELLSSSRNGRIASSVRGPWIRIGSDWSASASRRPPSVGSTNCSSLLNGAASPLRRVA